jgi:hypothetical protein
MRKESGSALLYILIAIVLFAALSFAIAQMSRGGGEGAGEEVRRLQASEILQYARGMQTTVQSLKIEGAEDTQLSFQSAALGAGYNYASCGDACQIFSPSGGGMIYSKPSADWLDQANSGGAGYGDWIFSGSNAVTGVGTDGGGADSAELLMILPWVDKSLCTEINDMLGIDNPGSDPPADAGNAELATKFTGTYAGMQTIGGGDPEIDGERAGCFEGGGAPAPGTYHFFQVLIAR